jgi:MscS family membrane protein
MKAKSGWIFRGGLVLLLVVAGWSLWANAQPLATNAPAPILSGGTTNLLSRTLSTLDRHYLTFGLDRVAVLTDHSLLGEPLWKYAASALYILLAFLVARFLDFGIGVWLKRWAQQTETKFDDLLLELFHGPVKVVAFVILLHVGLNLFQWSPAVQAVLSKGLIVVVALSITYLLVKLADLALGFWHDRTEAAQDKLFSEHLFPIIQKAARTAIIVGAVVLTADNLGIRITSLLAGLSIGGLALGLAAQDTVANLFGAVSIFLDKPFHIGDRIRLESVDGTVESIGLRSTRVRSLDGHHVTIPNKTMGNTIITNVTRRPNIRTEMNLGLTYDTPADKVRRAVAILEEVYRSHPQTGELVIGFNKFADSALNIMIVHVWTGTDHKAYVAGMQELNLTIKQRFDAEKIDFAFPTQTIHLKPAA